LSKAIQPSVPTHRFSIGISSREGKVSYRLHLSEAEAQCFAAFVAERTIVRA
jgi:hypothetical protein